MLTELFRLVIRGERGEGKAVDLAAHHLPQCHPRLPHFSNFPTPFHRRGLNPLGKDGSQKGSCREASGSGDTKGARKKSKRKSSLSSFKSKGAAPLNIAEEKPIQDLSEVEDSFSVLSHHSSKHSLFEGRHQVVDLEPALGAAPLSHKAARHKISVRPKRTHGAPRSKRQVQGVVSNLPITPEVNEDLSVRSGAESFSLPSNAQSIPQPKQRPSSVICVSPTSVQNAKTKQEWSEERKRFLIALPDTSLVQFGRTDEQMLYGAFDVEQQRQNADDSVTGAWTRGDEQRMSREKSKDPLRGGNKSGRQKSDPTRLSHITDRNGSQRSSSVEGRLEGNLFSSPYQRSQPPVTTIQAPTEVTVERDATSQYSVFTERQERNIEETLATSRVSSSYDELDTECGYPDMMIKTKPSVTSLESFEGRSSTDSLTTTPLPGIYIRSNHSINKLRHTPFQSHARDPIRWREERPQEQFEQDRSLSGPMSLDSSISAIKLEEEILRKTLSVDEVASDEVSWSRERMPSGDTQCSDISPGGVARAGSVHSPPSSGKRLSVRSRTSSTGDELESDSSLTTVSLRKINRESMHRKQSEEIEKETVPEFMRIQLNRVQSKGSAVIFDTEQNALAAGGSKISPTFATKGETAKETVEIMQKDDTSTNLNDEIEKSGTHSGIIVSEKDCFELNVDANVAAPLKDEINISTHSETVPARVPSHSGKEIPSKHSIETESSRKDDKEEIVLRRPSVVDRAIVIDQTMNQCASPVSKKSSDEPELFKVFARRSFKLKDVDVVASVQEDENDIEDKVEPTVESQQVVHAKNQHSPVSVSNTGVIETQKGIAGVRQAQVSAIGITHDVKPGNQSEIHDIAVPDIEPIASQTEEIVGVSVKKLEKEGSTASSHVAADTSITVHDWNSRTRKENSSISGPRKNNSDTCTEGTVQPGKPAKFITGDSEVNVKDSVAVGSSPFNSAIIRRYSRSSSIVSSSENSATESQSPDVAYTKPLRTQAVVWPPRSQTSDSQLETSSVVEGSSQSGTERLSLNRGVSAFKETAPSVSVQDKSEVKTSKDDVPMREKPACEPRKMSLKDGNDKKTVLLAEARNSTFAHTFDNNSSSPLALVYVTGSDSKVERKGSTDERRSSAEGSEDWRVLVRQRREDRMKQMKTPEAEEIIIESRPNVSRNSKVLEMANNFQKLQVA